MIVKYFANYDEISKAAAEFVAEKIKNKPEFVLGLPTGSTPLGMYKNLIEMYKSGEADFSKITTFNLDEYYPIKKTQDTSYYKFMHDNFFDSVNVKEENINILYGECENPEKECADYEKKIEQIGGIDLMVLGIGANGHIGFNEPGKVLSSLTYKVTLTEDTREKNQRFFDSIDEVPKYAMTMGMGTIMKCRSIILLASGEGKRKPIEEMLKKNITTENPSTFLNLHPDVTIFTDIQ